MKALLAAALLVLALPATARAGTVSSDGSKITFAASATGNESVVVGFDSGRAFLRTDQAFTAGSHCHASDATHADCDGSAFLLQLLGGGDTVRTETPGAATLEVHGGAGNDDIEGTPNADALYGDADSDTIVAGDGNDILDGGPGDDTLSDGAGNDTVVGGPGGDTWHAGPGTDTFTPGDGSDSVDYRDRTAPVTITFNGLADDGEAGEADNVGADAEDAAGGSGNDTIVGNDLGDRLHGGAGNDYIKGGAGEDRIEGEEGDDTIDSRDGRYDSIDCGPGNDIVYGDPQDATENCEIAPDADGDGSLPPADCAPNDPAIHPGAGEIYGNPVDEDCDGVAGYLRVVSPIAYGLVQKKKQGLVRFATLVVKEVQRGDVVDVTCNKKAKGCPFKHKKVTVTSQKTVNVAKLLKKRFFKRGAVIEVRVLRANQIGKYQRYTVGKRAKVTPTSRCINVGATKPTRCS